jgi:hypothetical protein
MKQEQQQGSSSAPIDADWEWPDIIDAVALRRMAKVTLALLTQPERWIHRRVERIYFKDHQRVHRQVSVDFTLPAGVQPVGEFNERRIYIAPLFLLTKDPTEPLREGKRSRRRFIVFGRRRPSTKNQAIPTAPYSNLNYTRQDSRHLPLVSRRQSSQLATRVLLEAAEQAIGQGLTKELEERISAIPHRSWAELNSELENVLKWLLEEKVCYWWDQRIKLREDKIFPELVYTLASHSIISSLLMDSAPRRSIHKLSYDEPLYECVPKPRGGFWRSLGWASEQYYVPLSEIGASASYHIEMEVPKELEINAVSVVGKRYKWYDERRSENNQDYSIQQIGSADEGKVYIPEPLPGRRVGLAWVKLRARRTGFLVSAFATSGITTGLLALAASRAPYVLLDKQSEAAAAAFLLVPALIAALIARPGEHAITAKMLRWARIALVLNALLPAFAVFFLITENFENSPNGKYASWLLHRFSSVFGGTDVITNGGTELQIFWTALAVVSLFLTLLFAVSYFLPVPFGKTVYQPESKRNEAGNGGRLAPA